MRGPRHLTQEEVDRLARTLHRRQVLSFLASRGFAVRQAQADSYAVSDLEGRPARLDFQPDGGIRLELADGRTTTRWFDSDGRLVRLVDPGGLEIRVSPAPYGGQRIERVGHGSHVVATDPFGLPTRVEFPDGGRSSIDWDTPGGETLVDEAGSRPRRLRDETGKQVGALDVRGGLTRFSDETTPAGRILTRVTPAGRIEAFGLDPAGRLASWSVDGQRIAEARGESLPGLPAEIRYADGCRIALTAANGRLDSAEGPNGTVRFAYDAQGRLAAEDQAGLLVRYERDATGLLTGIVLPDGARLGFAYDAGGRIASVRDWDGAVTRVSWAPNGQLAGLGHPNGVTTQISSDPLARITQLATSRAGSALFEARYGYDAADRLVEAHENGVARGYAYDPCGRLTGVRSSDPGLAEDWTLDAAGNRVRDGSVPYAADPDDRVSGPGPHAIGYDALGRTRTVATPEGPARLDYDGRGQLVRVALATGRTAEYGYDALGRRIWKRVDGRLTRFVWAGLALLSEWTDDPQAGFTRRDHLFLPDMFLPLAMRVDGRTVRVHCDRRGAPTTMTDAAGAPVWEATLSAFGTARVGRAAVSCPWRLANQYADAETGLHYNVARYAHPGLGRFLTPDPLRDPQTRGNLYLYAAGDPLGRSDPTGEFVIPAVLIGLAVGAVVGAGISAWQNSGKGLSPSAYAWEVAKGGLLGGLVGAVGALAGGAALAAAGLSTSSAGGIGALMGIAGLEGAVASVAEACAEAAIAGRPPSLGELAMSAAIGATVGAVTMAIGGAVLARIARKRARIREAQQPDYFDAKLDIYPNSPYRDKSRPPSEIVAEINNELDKARSANTADANQRIAAENAEISRLHAEYVKTGHWKHDGLDDFQFPDKQLKKENMLYSLQQSGVKHNPSEIIGIRRDKTGRVVFLENGNERAGMTHIVSRHGEEFAKQGLEGEKLAEAIMTAATEGEVIGKTGKNRLVYEYEFDGQTRRMAVTVSENGFVVGANPVSSSWRPQ